MFDDESQKKIYDLYSIDIDKVSPHELEEIVKTLTTGEKVRLFNRYEDQIINNVWDRNKSNILIENLPSDIRMKYLKYYDFGLAASMNNLLNGITNEDDIFKVASVALNNNSKYGMYTFLEIVPYERRKEFLKLIALREKELGEDIINSYNINLYLNKFKLEDRLDVIENVIFKDFQKEQFVYDDNGEKIIYKVRFSQHYYSRILKCFSEEKNVTLEESKMYECFKFLCEECLKIRDKDSKETVGMNFPGEVVKVFFEQGYNINKIIEDLRNSKLINSYGLKYAIEGLPVEAQKDAIEFIIGMDNYDIRDLNYIFYTLLGVLPMDAASELFIKYCFDEPKFDYLYPLNRDFLGHSTFDYLSIIFPNLTEEEFNASFDIINGCIVEMLKYPKYDEKYNVIVEAYAKKYDVDMDKLRPFVQKFGYNILKQLNNENIQKFISMDISLRERLFALFSEDTTILSKGVMNDILNALFQREFRLEEADTVNIFSTFENLFEQKDSGSFDRIKDLLEEISLEYDYSKILESNKCNLEDLYKQIGEGNLNLLHEITDKYIAFRREKFVGRKLLELDDLLQMDKVITRESYLEVMIDYPSSITAKCKELTEIDFTEDQKRLINDQTLMRTITNFKKNPKENHLAKEHKKYLYVLKELINILYDNTNDYKIYRADNPVYKNLKFEFIQGEISNEFLVGVLMEANFEGVLNVISNDEYYYPLKAYLEKYKIMGWQDIFAKITAKADIQFDEGTVASFLCNFDKIKKDDRSSTLTSILDSANCYATFSNYFRVLFGVEDANFIASNPGPNKSTMPKRDRLNACRDSIPAMYRKEFITTPTINKNFTLKNGKSIRIVLGNATNMMNLTYGERTGACMRKGGPFDGLFEHCLTDKNGFHIGLFNPKTGELISRVSGTRNGNTVFLNELRNSLDTEYDNEDLYEVIKEVARALVEISRDSSVPIDNVLITADYALANHRNQNQSLNISQPEKKKALRNVPFNFTNIGILLANSSNDNKIMPYIFTDDLAEYETIRSDVKTYFGPRAINRILQIKMINGLINGKEPEKEVLAYDGELPDRVVSGEDYYIAYKNGNVLETFVLDLRKTNKRTLEELSAVLKDNEQRLDRAAQNEKTRY